jgi:hypothetical protein
MASAAWRKAAGVPVEFSVATIFCATMALFPIPADDNPAFAGKDQLHRFFKLIVEQIPPVRQPKQLPF